MRRSPAADALRALQDVDDELEALLTCPTERAAERVDPGRGRPRPAVDPRVWLDHVTFHRHRRPEARARLVEEYHDHARRLAQRYYRHGEPIDDLEQVASEGLLLALERFDPRRGLPFLGFANPTIIGSLKRHYRDAGWALRVPRRVHDLSSALRAAHEQLAQDLRRPPTVGELADLLGVDPEQVHAAQEAERVRASASIEATSDDEGGLREQLGGIDHAFTRVEDLAAVQGALRHLSDESCEVIRLYFAEGLTQQEIGRRIGVSQMQVSRLLDRALGQIRSHVGAD